MILRAGNVAPQWWLLLCFALSLLVGKSRASIGDRLPEFKLCVATCKETNCAVRGQGTFIPLHRRLLLWDCPSECDYTCQHIVTDAREARDPPYLQPVQQFHGKWPFHRFAGLQEPFSVLFSLANFAAHARGAALIRARLPASFGLRAYYLAFSLIGRAAWLFSIIFHARDTWLTEMLDYFAAGATVLFGLYYAPLRIFLLVDDDELAAPQQRHQHQKQQRGGAEPYSESGSSGSGLADGRSAGRGTGKLSRRSSSVQSRSMSRGRPQHRQRRGRRRSLVRAWTALCLLLYAGHVGFLSLVRWDYTYNMAANVAVGLAGNLLWAGFGVVRYRRLRRAWAAWPVAIVACLFAATSLELLDFPPWRRLVDAHALWHLATVVPTFWWYCFLVKDSEELLSSARRKA